MMTDQQDLWFNSDGNYLPDWAINNESNVRYLTWLKSVDIERHGILLMDCFAEDLWLYRFDLSDDETLFFLTPVNHTEPILEKIVYAVKLKTHISDWFTQTKVINDLLVWRDTTCKSTARVSSPIIAKFILPYLDNLIVNPYLLEDSLDFCYRLLPELLNLGVLIYAVGVQDSFTHKNNLDIFSFYQILDSDTSKLSSKYFNPENKYRFLFTTKPL